MVDSAPSSSEWHGALKGGYSQPKQWHAPVRSQGMTSCLTTTTESEEIPVTFQLGFKRKVSWTPVHFSVVRGLYWPAAPKITDWNEPGFKVGVSDSLSSRQRPSASDKTAWKDTPIWERPATPGSKIETPLNQTNQINSLTCPTFDAGVGIRSLWKSQGKFSSKSWAIAHLRCYQFALHSFPPNTHGFNMSATREGCKELIQFQPNEQRKRRSTRICNKAHQFHSTKRRSKNISKVIHEPPACHRKCIVGAAVRRKTKDKSNGVVEPPYQIESVNCIKGIDDAANCANQPAPIAARYWTCKQ